MNANQSPRSEPYEPAKADRSNWLASPILRGFLVMVLLGVVGAALGASLTEPNGDGLAEAEARRLPVNVITVQPVDSFEVTRTYTGTIAARRSSELGFERAAIVTAVAVDQGDQVTAGQTIAQLDTRQLQIQLGQLQARRDESMAVLDELKAGPRIETIAAARASVDDLKAQVELQQRLFRRSSQLVKEYATSEERVDEAELGLRSAQAKLLVAQQQLQELEEGTRPEKISAQKAAVAQLEQQIADLRVEISDSELVAPFDGRIASRYVDEGTVISPTQPVIKLVESGHLEARIGIPPAALPSLHCDQSFDVTVNGQTWPAKLARVAPELDPSSRTRLAIFEMNASATDVVVPGQIVRVSVAQQLSTDGFWLPTSALVRSVRGLWAAYVIVDEEQEQVIKRQDVEVLHTEGQRTLVRGTLLPGDRVIASGTHRVVPGQHVSVIQSVRGD